ncbi:DUF2183 domain-containing protein [Euzebyella marina]|uniref:DUF2183 domain-containing protein n=1 Tax=Euzebyella marina TaxID=1761453 RepID=A0A3G2L5W4_9FLAO|nr:phosphatase domain-containing protein [Euzebyella marina]AYN67561.1 DUF2183 domain-containing protein [Euzebyella marina]
MAIVLQTYKGYANEQEIIIFGHLYSRPEIGYDFQGRKIRHAVEIFKMFKLQPFSNHSIVLKLNGIEVQTKTLKDGYFRFSIPYSYNLSAGWHLAELQAEIEGKIITEKVEFIKPYPGEYGLISDIDDTFLISHTRSLFKKIYVLLTQNIHRRKIFTDVLQHYRILSNAGRKKNMGSNAFFYVSSSEWNLYNFINEFTDLNEFPKAVFKLKKLKTGLLDFLRSGGGNHDHKFHKIKHIIEFYPELKFILIGDDTQQDPYIYERIVKLFPLNISIVYLRQTGLKPKVNSVKTLSNIETMGVETLYFKDSSIAIEHSTKLLA